MARGLATTQPVPVHRVANSFLRTEPSPFQSMPLHRKPSFLLILVSLLVLQGLTGCSAQLEEMRERYRPSSAREAYIQGLVDTGIDDSAIASEWLRQGEVALGSPVEPTLPYREEGQLVATDIMAVGYRLSLRRGQQVRVEAESGGRFDVFVDLYEVLEAEGLPPRRLASADSLGLLEVDIHRTRDLLLRIQPEILAAGSFSVTIQTGASLVFPVSGQSTGAVGSFFGDVRDGGRRDHHGLDIFAPRGTPVVAVRSGVVRSTRTTGLGGKQVWLRDEFGNNFYYAHLDEWLVDEGQRVAPGDTLGRVGNTGNARTTPPHLHFGIYQQGPHDPWPFVFTPDRSPGAVALDRSLFGSWRQATASNITLRRAPDRSAEAIRTLDGSTPVLVVGGARSWYHVRLSDGSVGYMQASDLMSSLAAKRPAPGQSTPETISVSGV